MICYARFLLERPLVTDIDILFYDSWSTFIYFMSSIIFKYDDIIISKTRDRECILSCGRLSGSKLINILLFHVGNI